MFSPNWKANSPTHKSVQNVDCHYGLSRLIPSLAVASSQHAKFVRLPKQDVMKTGARGYVLKSDATRDLTASIEAFATCKLFFAAKESSYSVKGDGSDTHKS
jgi:DNA-binding NarL/FixJ family response regulator